MLLTGIDEERTVSCLVRTGDMSGTLRLRHDDTGDTDKHSNVIL